MIPENLILEGKYCCWRYEDRDGRKTKVPYNPKTNRRARSNDPAGFADYETAVAAISQYDGIGIGIFDGICAIDLDNCITDAGRYTQTAIDVIELMHSYTEVSPSGNGIHILFVADAFVYNKSMYYVINHDAGIEVYVAGATSKYVTVTGQPAEGCDYPFGDRTAELSQLLDRYMCRPEKTDAEVETESPPAYPATSDDVLLGKALQSDAFCRLWHGDTDGYKSHSEADIALCGQLAFWTGKDASRMDALFRQSGLMRSKWDETRAGSTYGRDTIAKAIASCRKVYVPQVAMRSKLETVSLTDLFSEQYPSNPAVIDSLLYPGLAVLYGDSKVGKSFLALQLGYSVCAGNPFLGFACRKGTVLYLSLEDTISRLQRRAFDVIGPVDNPDMHFATICSKIGEGLEDEIAGWCDMHPGTLMIIIDTLQCIRSQQSSNAYADDYSVIQTLKSIADTRGVCIMLLHHSRKKKSNDVYANINGTTAIMGAADTVLCLSKDSRDADDARLDVTGRDVETQTIHLVRQKGSLVWDFDCYMSETRVMPPDPVLGAVAEVIDTDNPRWTGTATELCEIIGVEVAPNALTARLNCKADELWADYHIKYSSSRNHNGRKIVLEYVAL